MRRRHLRNRRLWIFRIAIFVALFGWPTVASSEPPAGFPSDKSAWQITFGKGDAENPIQAFYLDACMAVLQADPKTNIDIVSYGDLAEPVEANIALAQKRGEWVVARIRSAVVQAGGRVLFRGSNIDPRRLRIVNKGGLDAGRDHTQVEIYYR